MSEENAKTSFGTRVANFINAFDVSPSDYVFDNIRRSREKLNEIEARVARLENAEIAVNEVTKRKAS